MRSAPPLLVYGVVDVDQRVAVLLGEPLFAEDLAAHLGLERCEPDAAVVVAMDEPHRPGTDVADAVEQHDRSFLVHGSARRGASKRVSFRAPE